MVFIYFGTPCIWPRIVSLARLYDKDLRFPAVQLQLVYFYIFFTGIFPYLFFWSLTIKSFIF